MSRRQRDENNNDEDDTAWNIRANIKGIIHS